MKVISVTILILFSNHLFSQKKDNIKIYENKYLNYVSGSLGFVSLNTSTYNMNLSIDPAISAKKDNYILNIGGRYSYLNGILRRLIGTYEVNNPIQKKSSNSINISFGYLFLNEFPKNANTSKLHGITLGFEKGRTEYFFDSYDSKNIEGIYTDNNTEGILTIPISTHVTFSNYYYLNGWEGYEIYRNYRSVFTYYNYNFLSLGYNIYKQRDYKESINGKTSSSFTTNTRFYTKLLFNINSFYDNIIVKNFPVEGSLLYTLREMDINSKMKNLPIGLKIGFEDNKYDEHGITYSTEVYLFPGSNYSAYLNLGIDFKIRYTFCKGIK